MLGDDLAEAVVRNLTNGLGSKLNIVSAARFREALGATNRSLADLTGPETAVSLAARAGARYIVLGTIGDSRNQIELGLQCVDASDARVLARTGDSFNAGEALAHALFARFKSPTGQPLLSAFRIGSMAPAVESSLNAELQWIFSNAASEILASAGQELSGKTIAIPPTQLPTSFRFRKMQLAFARQVNDEKNFFISAGLSETAALEKGPVHIMGMRFRNLREAKRYADGMQLESELSRRGELASTLGRILFDELEVQGRAASVEVIPHDQLIEEAVQFSRQEVERIKDGILDEDSKEFFETKGASALVLTELIESGDSYEFVLQVRRLDNLRALTGQIRTALEPRFAYQLRKYMK